MSKNKVPEICFNGFSKELVETRLGDICTIGDIDHRMPKSVLEGIPYLMTGDFIDNNGLDFKNCKFISIEDYEQLSRKIKPEVNDILFARYASVGDVRYVETDIKFLISYSCAIIKCNKDIVGRFLFYYLQSNRIQYQIEININTGSQRNIGIDSLKKLTIFIPKIEEQERIGNYFQQLDKLIEQKEKKYQKLKQFKKAMLDKMFPKNGADTPEIRFKGFIGKWEEKEINELFIVTRGDVLAATETSSQKSEKMPYPVYSSQTKNNGLLGFYKKYLFENAITWTTDGANAGTVKYREGKFYSTNVNGVLLSNDGYANLAIAEILNNIAWKHVSYVGNPKLMNNVMSKIKIIIPNTIEEQIQISKYIKQLDKQIDLQQKELEKLKNIKKASLAKMFV
ncbi:restriction endonuclease subunit S [Aliarcobacter butzleri]|uniref:Restriction endonuclease subunit S n=2 Tax=Aliarcobacter butzleri TaxID=28197 RepID=A0AAP4Q2J2_9BACT|nr:restriction endonuclease subunit S [Aliarcobacter butzleri]MDN5053123.1 restriction endonuclease subunit S [Aliarcobacter butzleri]MDN5076277.1 restriction endonuclease subunit S [Aliarcobacter butzleri]MDN5117548.1 restriction endonuclease subunit S [Aliarcobacter butzleri]MDN5133364.1 restriction endonuclease subunit S [Aliarcobacter butzleri]